MQLPTINLQGVDSTFLVFWHWHDFEISYDEAGAPMLWDGGNVKLSTDGGTSWDVAVPQEGYDGILVDGRTNPLEREPAFGGYSYGWRRSIVVLPTGGSLDIRFDFATDADNEGGQSVGLGGWWLDDVALVTSTELDSLPPTLFSSYPDVSVIDAGMAPPSISITTRDDAGIGKAYVAYETISTAGTVRDTLRLDMDYTNQAVYSGAFPSNRVSALTTGDRINFRIFVSDVHNQVTTQPLLEEAPYQFEYRLRERIDLLPTVQATGYWRATGEDWIAVREGSNDEEPPIVLSSLLSGPHDLPTNVDQLEAVFTVKANMNTRRLGGNVKIATGRATDWQVIEPSAGYPRTFPEDDATHPMLEEPAFNGLFPQAHLLAFDLLPYKGQQIWLRVDLGAIEPPSGTDFWRIEDAALSYSTLEAEDGGFTIPRTLTLHPNYPDPFSDQTTLSYTLPEPSTVFVDVHDVLGRRVAVLVDQQQPAGTYSITLDGSNLSSGLYFLRLLTDTEQLTERLMVRR